MKGIKLIIFDLDGTLVDAYRAITESFNFVMSGLRYPRLDPLTIRRAVGWGDANLLKPFVAKKDLNRAVNLYRRHHQASLLKGSRLFPRVRRILRSLRNKGFYLAVASNRPQRFSEILIRHLKIDKYFDYVLCADKLRHAKPHPEILRKIMRKLRVKPCQAVYVGDMFIDAQAGSAAGLRTIIVITGSSTLSEIKKQKPFYIIHNLSGLLKLF